MKFWVDAQLPPVFARWLSETFEVEAAALRDIGLRDAKDREIFDAAKVQNAVIISKDSDFIELVSLFGAPPQILWVTCGNVTNKRLREIFREIFPKAVKMLESGEFIVEIGDV